MLKNKTNPNYEVSHNKSKHKFTFNETILYLCSVFYIIQKMLKRFETKLLEEAFEFIKKQNFKTRKKILQNIRRAEQQSDLKFFKKLTDEIWEFRTLYSGIQYRLLAFWDKDDKTETLVLTTHGIVKKKSKVDNKEIDKANKIRIEYFKNTER